MCEPQTCELLFHGPYRKLDVVKNSFMGAAATDYPDVREQIARFQALFHNGDARGPQALKEQNVTKTR